MYMDVYCFILATYVYGHVLFYTCDICIWMCTVSYLLHMYMDVYCFILATYVYGCVLFHTCYICIWACTVSYFLHMYMDVYCFILATYSCLSEVLVEYVHVLSDL